MSRDVAQCRASEEEVSFSLRDEDGVQVSVRLTAEAVRQLRERLILPPDETP